MKINRFDVVELNNGNRATILDIKDRQTYFADIVNAYGITVDCFNNVNINIYIILGVNAPIIFGADDETILRGVGHDSGTYFPGENSSIIMCEHDYMNNFGRLGELSDGDIIEIETNYGDFFYKKYD